MFQSGQKPKIRSSSAIHQKFKNPFEDDGDLDDWDLDEDEDEVIDNPVRRQSQEGFFNPQAFMIASRERMHTRENSNPPARNQSILSPQKEPQPIEQKPLWSPLSPSKMNPSSAPFNPSSPLKVQQPIEQKPLFSPLSPNKMNSSSPLKVQQPIEQKPQFSPLSPSKTNPSSSPLKDFFGQFNKPIPASPNPGKKPETLRIVTNEVQSSKGVPQSPTNSFQRRKMLQMQQQESAVQAEKFDNKVSTNLFGSLPTLGFNAPLFDWVSKSKIPQSPSSSTLQSPSPHVHSFRNNMFGPNPIQEDHEMKLMSKSFAFQKNQNNNRLLTPPTQRNAWNLSPNSNSPSQTPPKKEYTEKYEPVVLKKDERMKKALGFHSTMETLIFVMGLQGKLKDFINGKTKKFNNSDLSFELSPDVTKTNLKLLLVENENMFINWFEGLKKEFPTNPKYYKKFVEGIEARVSKLQQQPSEQLETLECLKLFMKEVKIALRAKEKIFTKKDIEKNNKNGAMKLIDRIDLDSQHDDLIV